MRANRERANRERANRERANRERTDRERANKERREGQYLELVAGGHEQVGADVFVGVDGGQLVRGHLKHPFDARRPANWIRL